MKIIQRIPWLPLGLWALWLLLNDSISVGQVILGGIFAFLVSAITGGMRPLRAQPRRIMPAFKLIAHVAIDVLRSNLAVARIVLGRDREGVHSGFMRIPLEMTDPHGLAILSGILTATPGSVWTDFTDGVLLLHVLDMQDEAAWHTLIKDRYEKPLMEIFE